MSQKPLDLCRAYGVVDGKECGYNHISPRHIEGVPPGLIMRYVIEQYVKFHGQDPDQVEWTTL